MRNLIRPLMAVLVLTIPACATVPPTEVSSSRESATALALPEQDDVFQFVIFGDRTGGYAKDIAVLAQAVDETNLIDPDLVMTVGDLVQGYNETPEWLEQMREYKSTMAGLDMPWYPVAGNHDIYWVGGEPPPGHHEGNYENNFGPLWYWFPHKNAAFIVLYTDEGNRAGNEKGFVAEDHIQMSGAQLEWLERTLRETAAYDHVFLFMHHPRWDTDRYRSSNWEMVHGLLDAVGNVSAVFAGHYHRQRYDGERDGIRHYILATLGGIIPIDVPGTGWLYHMDLVTVRKDDFEIATIPVGSVYDPETMTRKWNADIVRARKMPVTVLTERVELESDGGARGEIRFGLENRAERPIEVEVALEHEGSDWLVRPDHRRLSLGPAESGEIAFELERPDDEFRGRLSVPKFSFQVDYLGENRRVSLPPDHLYVPLRPPSSPVTDGQAAVERAMVLDGSGTALWFAPDSVALEEPPMTLEALVRTESLAGDRVLIGKFDRSGYALVLSNGHPRLVLGLETGLVDIRSPDHVVEPGRWHHVAGVFDGTEARLYLDGQLVARAEAAGPIKSNYLPLYIGANPTNSAEHGAYFGGALDEVRLSTTARYAGERFEPSRRHEADEATALLLHLDRDEAAFAIDASTGQRHGIFLGAPQFTAR